MGDRLALARPPKSGYGWAMSHRKAPTDLRCDFCGSLESQGREMVAGPGIYICDRCVDLCVEVLEKRKRDQPNESETPESF